MELREADLHMHTLASDGMDSASHIVRLAQEVGLAAIAITDHDTVAGIEEAVLEGKRFNIDVVPGVEISTVANGQDIHILGYDIDYRDTLLLERLKELRRTRDLRNDLLLAKLQELGMPITIEEVRAHLRRPLQLDETIGRPHIADVMMKKGYVESIAEAFEYYLGKQGKAYVNPPRLHPMDAVQWIHDAGGVAVLAHPGLYHDDGLVSELVAIGLDGIEVYHSDHTPQDEQKYEAMSNRFGLIATGGSDYHGERNGVLFHGPIGHRSVSYNVVEQLRIRRKC